MTAYPIAPVPKPRMTQADRWKQRPAVLRYRAFADEVRIRNVQLPCEGATIRFILPMPPSWSKKKRLEMNGKPHTQRPDLSNLLKALEDACHVDDAHIHHYAGLSKVWGTEGGIEIE